MWKKLGLGLITALAACTLLAGCGGDAKSNDGSKNTPPEPPIKKLDLKIGSVNAKYYPLLNESQQVISGSSVGISGEELYAYNRDKKAIQKYEIKRDKLVMKKDNFIRRVPYSATDPCFAVTGRSIIVAAGHNVYGFSRYSSFVDVLAKHQMPYIRTSSTSKKLYGWKSDTTIYTAELNDKAQIVNRKTPSKYQRSYQSGPPSAYLTKIAHMAGEFNGFYIFGDRRVEGSSCGVAYFMDLNGKIQKRFNYAPKGDAAYVKEANGGAVTDKYVVLSDQSHIAIYDKKTSNYLGSASMKEPLGNKAVKAVIHSGDKNAFYIMAQGAPGDNTDSTIYRVEL